MKLLYATALRFPSPITNRLQVAAMAREWGRQLGDQFVLGVAENRGVDFDNCFEVFGINLHSIQLAWRYIRFIQKENITHVYCREEKLLFFISLYAYVFRVPVRLFYEMHELTFAHRWWFRFLLRRLDGMVVLTSLAKEEFAQLGFIYDRILVAPDAVDLARFEKPPVQKEARDTLAIPSKRKVAIYAGTIEGWKGVNTLYAAAQQLPDVLFVIVGGRGLEDFVREHPASENVRYEGQVPNEKIPLYFAAADVLILPNTDKHESSRVATSPMKLFEYMASGTPIVSSDLPSLRDVLNDGNARLVSPDNPEALASGIRKLLENPKTASALARQAREDVQPHTWDRRAGSILQFIMQMR